VVLLALNYITLHFMLGTSDHKCIQHACMNVFLPFYAIIKNLCACLLELVGCLGPLFGAWTHIILTYQKQVAWFAKVICLEVTLKLMSLMTDQTKIIWSSGVYFFLANCRLSQSEVAPVLHGFVEKLARGNVDTKDSGKGWKQSF
jgi:hypothetical protein